MILSPGDHQRLHFAHLALEEAVDADFAAVGVEGDGGEAGEREKIPVIEKQSQGYETMVFDTTALFRTFGIRRVILDHLLA